VRREHYSSAPFLSSLFSVRRFLARPTNIGHSYLRFLSFGPFPSGSSTFYGPQKGIKKFPTPSFDFSPFPPPTVASVLQRLFGKRELVSTPAWHCISPRNAPSSCSFHESAVECLLAGPPIHPPSPLFPTSLLNQSFPTSAPKDFGFSGVYLSF